MTKLSDVLTTAIVDARLSREELLAMVDAGTTPTGQATPELKKAISRYRDALEPEAAFALQEMEKTLGITVEAAPDLRNSVPLRDVWAGKKVLSAKANTNDPGVVVVQR